MSFIDWEELRKIAERLEQPGLGGGSAMEDDLRAIDRALALLSQQDDHAGILRLRSLLTPVVARDSISIHESLRRLADAAIHSAEVLGDHKELAHLLGADGHNLHRQGLHHQALAAFSRSHQLYTQAGEPTQVLKMASLMAQCHRALGDTENARGILENILSNIDPNQPWFGNPLQVLGWIERDARRLDRAENIFRQALELHRQEPEADILMAGTLADLGEVIGLQRRHAEARDCFEESLELIRKHPGLYDRQEARAETKFAELLIRERQYSQALQLLDHADDLISYGTYRDQLWKIELLRAMIKFRQGKIGGALRRMRSAKAIYESLDLPPKEFVRLTVSRLLLGSGLFSFRRK